MVERRYQTDDMYATNRHVHCAQACCLSIQHIANKVPDTFNKLKKACYATEKYIFAAYMKCMYEFILLVCLAIEDLNHKTKYQCIQ